MDRAQLGLPYNWQRVKTWLQYTGKVIVGAEKKIKISLKNPEIPILKNYTVDPPNSFWKKFPSAALPLEANSRIKTKEFEDILLARKDSLNSHVIARAKKAIDSIKNGANAFQKTKLPPCFVKNAKSTFEHGEATTDTIVTWVKKGFACGPFEEPPLEGFRVNCLMALPQNQKVRPVLNASLPEQLSLNSNVDDRKVEKVVMCSARCFSYSVQEAGKFAWIAKLDMCDAYKNVPAKTEDLHLQGFSWLGKFFAETRQIFGAKTAVANFDILGSTVLELTLANCKIQRELVHRQLDDVPIVAPFAKKEWVLEFTAQYKEICEKIDILLAADCAEYDKAFSCSHYGKVLGIWFDTKSLSWSYPEEKTDKVLRAIKKTLCADTTDLLNMQKLMGSLNDVALMCPFLKGFKGPLNEILGWLQCNIGKTAEVSAQAKRDLLVWASFLQDEDLWKPICPRPIAPPLAYISFTSDAAGFRAESDMKCKVGVGGIGFDEDGKIIYATQLFWPDAFRLAFDKKGKFFGNKTATLEMVGLILPFLLCPELIQGKHIVLKVDNISCYYGWQSKNIAGDCTASILVRTLLILSAYLSCYVHVERLPRVSTWDAIVCDNLSREKTTGIREKRILAKVGFSAPEVFTNWLENPDEDWEIVNRLLEYVENK